MADRTHMDAWFIHPKLTLNLLDADTATAVRSRLPDASTPMWKFFQTDVLERALAEAFARLRPVSVVVAIAEGTLDVGQLVWVEQRFYYRGVDKALEESGAGRPGRADFHAPLATDRNVKVSGTYNVEHLTSNTSAEMLSGADTHFILGYVQELAENEVTLRPILIADRWGPGVHEPEIPKDWGGEQYDLWTDRITINGKRVQAAIALKGPAKFHPMTVADLGKNGDQVSRLAHTAADLLVVQHCHTITAQVIHLLHAYAANPGYLRRYLTINGYDTIRILRHFGYLT